MIMKSFLSISALLATFSCAPAYALDQCVPTEVGQAYISDNYQETPTWTGLSNVGVLIHIWTNEETGTWTLFTEDTEGVSCLIARGEAFEIIPPPIPGELN